MDSPIADSAVNVDSLIIGAGQAGLAMSACLRMRDIEHVVLERGRIGERWRSERWDSFTLLSPNWQTRLPGHHYRGGDPDGFMTGPEVVDLLERYAAAAPVRTGVTVHDARPDGDGWRVSTSDGGWRCRNIVVATGDLDQPRIPAIAADLPPELLQLHTSEYRNPGQLPGGGVLVVGAAPSGQQIADELARSGRPVHLAVGRHQMLPRRYRGQDSYWWMDRLGMLSRTADTLSHPDEKYAPNAVLTGGVHDLDLHRLVMSGVRPHGRLTGIDSTVVTFADNLERTVGEAEGAAVRFRAAVDEYVRRRGLDAPRERFVRKSVSRSAPWTKSAARALDLREQRISAVIWATGFTADRSWLPPDAITASGEPDQLRGVAAMTGLYFLGLKWMHRRSSHTVDGVGRDAEFLAAHISAGVADGERMAA